MIYAQYEKMQPKCLPSVDTVNGIRQKYYPGMAAIAPTADAPDSQCEAGKKAVTKDQLDEFVANAGYEGDPNDPNDGASNEANKALVQHDPGTLVKYVLGMGEVAKHERLMDDVAVATKNEPTGWLSDRIEDIKPIITFVKEKVVAMWTKFTNWLKSLFE